MEIERITLEPRQVVGVHSIVPMSELTAFFERAFSQSFTALAKAGLHVAGPAVAVYTGDVADTVDVTGGFPVAEPPDAAEGAREGDVITVTLPAGPAVACIHNGPYDAMSGTYEKLLDWMKQEHLTPGPTMWEEYAVGPDSVADPAGWRTRIVFPVS